MLHRALILTMLLVASIPIAYGAVISPQLEKLPEDVLGFYHSVDAQYNNNRHPEIANGEDSLQSQWTDAIYKMAVSTHGLDLPRKHTPNERDVTLYQDSQNGVCEGNFNRGEEPSRACKHQVAKTRTAIATWHFHDLMVLIQMSSSKTYMQPWSQDTFHERAVWCENPEIVWRNMFGNVDWASDDPQTVMLRDLRDSMTALMIHSIENNLTSQYKQALKEHIETDTFVDFYTGETKATHPLGNNYCDLG